MEIVVNEWLLEYLRPNADKSDREIALRFINSWVIKCDKIVIRRPSPFVCKFYNFMKGFELDSVFSQHYKKLNHLLFRNSDKTIIVDDADVDEIPVEVNDRTPKDDKYLIELGYSIGDKVIVTTDQRLKEIFKGESRLKICLLEEFIIEYSS